MHVTRPYSAVLGGLGRFGPLYRICFTIDYEGLYDGPYVHALGEYNTIFINPGAFDTSYAYALIFNGLKNPSVSFPICYYMGG